MTTDSNDSHESDAMLRDVWAGDDVADADADCSPTKVCRNAREFGFDGIGEGDEDLGTSWRKLLEREGKLSSGDTPSIRDLVLGSSND